MFNSFAQQKRQQQQQQRDGDDSSLSAFWAVQMMNLAARCRLDLTRAARANSSTSSPSCPSASSSSEQQSGRLAGSSPPTATCQTGAADPAPVPPTPTPPSDTSRSPTARPLQYPFEPTVDETLRDNCWPARRLPLGEPALAGAAIIESLLEALEGRPNGALGVVSSQAGPKFSARPIARLTGP